MMRIDTENIKMMTNQIIGYENYEKEKIMKRKQLKKITYAVFGIFILCIGTFTVNALTDNSVSNAVKDWFTITVDGDEHNASCIKSDDGTITCTVDKEVTGIDEDVSFDINYDEYEIDANYDSDNESTDISINER